jgi:hypothetical protein
MFQVVAPLLQPLLNAQPLAFFEKKLAFETKVSPTLDFRGACNRGGGRAR